MARESAQAYKTPEREYDVLRGQRTGVTAPPPPKTEFERAVRGSKSIFERSAMIEKFGGLSAREDPNPWVQILGGSGATSFSSLKAGDKFHFPGHPEEVHTKTSSGKYAAPSGAKFSTGKGSAVVPHAMQTGVRGGQFYISPSGAKVYKKENPGWVAEDPAKPDLVEPYKLGGNGPWKTG